MNRNEAIQTVAGAVQLRFEDAATALRPLVDRHLLGLARLVRDRPSYPEADIKSSSRRAQIAVSSDHWLAEAKRHWKNSSRGAAAASHQAFAFVQTRLARLQAENVQQLKAPLWEKHGKDPIEDFFGDVARSFSRTQTIEATSTVTRVREGAVVIEKQAWQQLSAQQPAQVPAGSGNHDSDHDFLRLLEVPSLAWWSEVKWAADAIENSAWRSDGEFLVERWGDYLRALELSRQLKAKLANPESQSRSCYKCGAKLIPNSSQAGSTRVDYDAYKDMVPPAPYCSRGEIHEAFPGQAAFVEAWPERFRQIRAFHSDWPGLDR